MPEKAQPAVAAIHPIRVLPSKTSPSKFDARAPILKRVILSPFLSATDKGVYIGICHHVGKGGYADVTHQQLADDMGLEKRQVQNAISKLIRVEVVTRVRRPGTRNIYYPTLK